MSEDHPAASEHLPDLRDLRIIGASGVPEVFGTSSGSGRACNRATAVNKHCWHSARRLAGAPEGIYVCCCRDGTCGAVIVHPGKVYEERSHGLLKPITDPMKEAVAHALELLRGDGEAPEEVGVE